MASRTTDELDGEMDHGGHICRENYESIGVKGPVPTSASGCGLDLHLRILDPIACGEHALETGLRGCIPELTHKGGPTPPFSTDSGHIQAMAYDGHI